MFNFQRLELKEFFDVYPKIIPITEYDNVNIFKKCFKKPIIPLEKLNEEKSKKKRHSFNKSKSLINPIKKNNRYSIYFFKINKNHLNNEEKYSKDDHNTSNLNLKNKIIQKYNEAQFVEEYKEDKDEEYKEYKEYKEDKEDNKNNIEEEEDYFLINKGMDLQKQKKKRTKDVIYSLQLFFFGSNFFEKLTKSLSVLNLKIKKSKKFLTERENENDHEMQLKIKNKLNNIVYKLSEKVIIKKYEKDNFVLKMNEIGKDCFFLISGKISILKPTEYNVSIFLREYFTYLKCLLNFEENELVLKVLFLNRKILPVTNVDVMIKLIKAYFIIMLRREIKRNYNGITMEYLEKFFQNYHFKFEDFNLTKDKILQDVEEIEKKTNNNNIDMILLNYISDKIPLLNEHIFILELYRIIVHEKEKNSMILYKYEEFLYLYPGSFFGDMALDSDLKKRNATIRTETDCIICSLSSEYYKSLLSEENKKLKVLDLIFLCHNFFFNLISPVIFNRTYYPMFKAVEKLKNAVLYKQNDDISSLYLVREGTLKIEIYANVFDLFDIIKNIINEIYIKMNNFNISLEEILEIKKSYLSDKRLGKIYSEEKISSAANKKINFELFTLNGYEFLGIQDFCLKNKYLSSCTVISNKALLMEIKKKDLSYMIKNEKDILPDYYNYVFNKLILFIKRLHYLKKNLINQIINNFDIKSYISNNISPKININMQGNNNFKQKIEILDSEKAKNIYNEKYNNFEGNLTKNINNYLSKTDRNYLSLKTKKSSKHFISQGESNRNNNSSNTVFMLNKYNLNNKRQKLYSSKPSTMHSASLHINKNQRVNTSISFSKTRNKKYRAKILSQNNNDENVKKISNDIVNTKHGYISIKKLKKNILKNNEVKTNISELNIVRKFILHNNEEKSVECDRSYSNIKQKKNIKINYKFPKNISIKKKKYDENKDNLTKDELENNSKIDGSGFDLENSLNRGNQSSINIKRKESSISNIFNHKEKNISEIKKQRNYSSSVRSLLGISKKYKNINNLIGNMKRNYAISKGQKKFIFYRKSRKNKAIDLFENKSIQNIFRPKNIGQSIKDYYFKKKVEGYSALVNPLHNTYINRQKTVKIKNKK